MRAIIFDTETSGLTLPSVADLDKQPRIIEIGAIAVNLDGIIGELSQVIDPGVIISVEITKITGLRQEDLAGKPSFMDFLPTLRRFFEGSTHFIAHNAPFDSALLAFDLQRVNCQDFPWPKDIVCTVAEYTPLFGRRPKLTELYERILGKPLAQTHRALDDCRALYEILLAESFLEVL